MTIYEPGMNEPDYGSVGSGYLPGQSVYNPQNVTQTPTTSIPATSGTTNEFVFPRGEDVKPYTGLPESYRDTLLSFAMPQLQQSVENLPQNIDTYTQNALATYRQELDRSLKEMMPQAIGKLADRGILNSSMAENILSQTYGDAARKSAGMGYQTAMEAAKMKTDIPKTVGELLQYGRYSEDPTVMYQTLASLLANMMP